MQLAANKIAFFNFLLQNSLKYTIIICEDNYYMAEGGICMSIFWTILSIILFSIVVFAAYSFAKVYGLGKLKVNKWIILALGIIVLVAQSYLSIYFKNVVVNYVLVGVFVFLFLWFMDLINFGNKAKRPKEKYVNKPKAKPQRAKFSDVQDQKTKNEKK